jgi:hypothetical protein
VKKKRKPSQVEAPRVRAAPHRTASHPFLIGRGQPVPTEMEKCKRTASKQKKAMEREKKRFFF